MFIRLAVLYKDFYVKTGQGIFHPEAVHSEAYNFLYFTLTLFILKLSSCRIFSSVLIPLYCAVG